MIRFLALSVTYFHKTCFIGTSDYIVIRAVTLVSGPSKGSIPLSITYMMIPRLQRSTFFVYGTCRRISGAT